jgi:fused signal recognition particle receptor
VAFFKGLISKLKEGLAKTREVLVVGLKSLILGRRLDEALIDDVERMLLEADVGPTATKRLIDAARADFRAGTLKESSELLSHLKNGLREMLAVDGRPPTLNLVGAPSVVLVTGVNGAGKTTSIAKLAKRFRDEGKTVLLGACDTFRAGAVRQLEVWGERVGVEVIKGQQGGDPAAVAFDACKAAIARRVDVLILDTAGRLQTQDPLMRQLAKIYGVVGKLIPGGPHEALLVLDATTGQNALRQAEEFAKHAPLTGIVLSKLDGTAKGGIVVAIRAASSLPVKFVGVGETPDDLQAFDPEAFCEALFGE